MRKSIIATMLFFAIAFGGVTSFASAQINDEESPTIESLLQQLQELFALVQSLQTQIQNLQVQQGELKEEIKATLQLTRQLREGMRNADVMLLQELLATDPEIYPEGLVTGYFGPLTKAAVRKFQKKAGIEQVGIVGPKTTAKINNLLEGAGKSGKIPPGWLISPGVAKKLGFTPEVPEGQKLPSGIAKKLGLPTSPPGNGDNGDGDGDEDTTAPTAESFSPADDAAGVAVDTDMVIIFSEVVNAGVGNITIKKSSNASTVETIDVGGTTGIGTDTITIDPVSDLATDTEYYILIDAGAFEDEASNPYIGILDSTTWNFATVDTITPAIFDVTAIASSTTAIVSWNTDEAADSTTWYGTSTPVVAGSPFLSASDASLGTAHSLDLSSLIASTVYNYFVVSQDAAGNTASSSEFSFTTLP